MTTTARATIAHRHPRLTGARPWPSLRWVLSAAAAVSVLMGPGADLADAQRIRAAAARGPGGPGPAAVTTRELDVWMNLLELNEDQRAAAQTLHQAYQEEFRQESRALQDLMKTAQQEFMETQDTSAFREIGKKSAVHTKKMEALDRQLMDDMKSLLEPRQAGLFPKVERHHRRVKSLPAGMLAGENVNLVAIVGDLDSGSLSAEFKEALEQYEIDLDRALVERDQQRQELEKQAEASMQDFDPSKMDFTKIREMMQAGRRAGVRVRDVNERHARRLSALLNGEAREKFEDKVRRATYPSVYRQPYVLKAIDAAIEFDDLTPDQAGGIKAIREGYLRDAAAVNERWAAAISTEEKDGGGDPFMGFGRMIPGGGGEEISPTEDAKKARRELDKATLEKVKALLTEAQADRLPERETEFPWMANFGGGDVDQADDKPSRGGGRRR